MGAVVASLASLSFGVFTGVVSERIALRPPTRSMDARIWNASVKRAVASSTVLALVRFSGLIVDGENDSNGGLSDNLTIAAAFAIYTMLLSAGSRVGSALQPIGLTGGIACGKSTVSALLKEGRRGGESLALIDLDEIAHDILIPGKMGPDSGYEHVVAEFGDAILEDAGGSTAAAGTGNERPLRQVDRRKLGEVVFADRDKRRKLNAITHPLITRVMFKRILREGVFPSGATSAVVVDIPLLYEVGYPLRILWGLEVVVACPPSIQLERLMKRDRDLTREQCQSRIDSQMPIDKKVKMANLVIWNTGSKEALEKEVGKVRDEISRRVQGAWGVTLPKLFLGLGFGVVAVQRLLLTN